MNKFKKIKNSDMKDEKFEMKGGDTCSEKNCSENSCSEKQNFDPSLILLRKKISEQYQ